MGHHHLNGGSTSFDDDDMALMNALGEWAAVSSYNDRVAISSALLTVFNDGEVDELTGSADLDLFYSGLGDDLTDITTGLELVL